MIVGFVEWRARRPKSIAVYVLLERD